MAYLKLTTAKYMEPIIREEWRMIRRARSARALRGFALFLVAVGALQGGLWAIRHADLWQPHLHRMLSASGYAPPMPPSAPR